MEVLIKDSILWSDKIKPEEITSFYFSSGGDTDLEVKVYDEKGVLLIKDRFGYVTAYDIGIYSHKVAVNSTGGVYSKVNNYSFQK